MKQLYLIQDENGNWTLVTIGGGYGATSFIVGMSLEDMAVSYPGARVILWEEPLP